MATDDKFEQEERKEGEEVVDEEAVVDEEEEWDWDENSEYYREGIRKIAEEYDRQGWPYDDVILSIRFLRREAYKNRNKKWIRD